MHHLRQCQRIAFDAFRRFNDDDGWAIASHIALSTLMSLFPFLIVVTALAGFIGSKELADEVGRILLETWPAEVASPIATEVHKVLTTARGDVLTIGAVFGVYFASSGIESVRIGLNRAYNGTEQRRWWYLQLESIGYVLLGAVTLLVLAFLVVLGPLIFAAAVKYARWLEPLSPMINFLRLVVASVVLVVALVFVHKWLPAGRRRLGEIVPGVVFTLAGWLLAGELFGRYLAKFAYAYVTYYAGLASAMIALMFLYLSAMIFIYGGELNAAIRDARRKGD
ncbi:MAG TPA: YihY/virulence factor BrkB family protein [Xanthobacteraceae bacterium]|nr:YihY/virulence factor BrkB family protein [Xanthobacteraceae bacterium]